MTLSIDDLREKLTQIPESVTISNTFFTALSGLLWLLLPIINIVNILFRISLGIYDITIISLFIVFLSISFLSVFHISYQIVSRVRSTKKFQIEYDLPLLSSFGEVDGSDIIFLLSQLLYSLFYVAIDSFVVHNIVILNTLSQLLLVLSVLIGISMIPITVSSYSKLKVRKEYCLQFLYNKLNTVKEANSKQYYLKLSLQLQNKKIFVIGNLPKISAFISFFLSVIPLISQLAITYSS